jgi:hypothetical protein
MEAAMSPEPFTVPPPTLRGFVAWLRLLPTGQRIATLQAAVTSLGGCLVQPGSASHQFELSLLGVHARASDWHELTEIWIRAADLSQPRFAPVPA